MQLEKCRAELLCFPDSAKAIFAISSSDVWAHFWYSGW